MEHIPVSRCALHGYTQRDVDISDVPPFQEGWNGETLRKCSVLHKESYVYIDISKVEPCDEVRATMDTPVDTIVEYILVRA